ncbi:MAG: hypothetical protein AAGI37_17895 [Planctomycetota bacterium]
MSDKSEQLDKALQSAKAKLEKTRADEKSTTQSREQAEAGYRRLTNLARHRNQPTFDAKYDKVATAHPKLLKTVAPKKPDAQTQTQPENPDAED